MSAPVTTAIPLQKSALDRCLCLFSRVEAGEGLGALLIAMNGFCLLSSYYVLKTAREALILSEQNAEAKSYACGIQGVVLLAVVPLYGAVASRVNRLSLMNGVMLFFILHLLLFHQLAVWGVGIGVPFFMWVGVFNLVAVAQFWSFANELHVGDRGERLLPVIGAGAALGAWAGAKLAVRLLPHSSPFDLLVVAAAGLSICVGLTRMAARRERDARRRPDNTDRPLGRQGGFKLISADRYLRLIVLVVVVTNVVNAIGEFLMGKLVAAEVSRTIATGAAGTFTKAQLIGMFYGEFFGWVNLLAVLTQIFVVSRVFRYVGVGGALFVLPVIALATYGMFALTPVLAAVRVGKILENSADYSVQNTARHALFLRTSLEAKYKAKQAIDGFFWRVGDMMQAVIVFVGVRLAFEVWQFAIINVVLVVIWLTIAAAICNVHNELAQQIPQSDAKIGTIAHTSK